MKKSPLCFVSCNFFVILLWFILVHWLTNLLAQFAQIFREVKHLKILQEMTSQWAEIPVWPLAARFPASWNDQTNDRLIFSFRYQYDFFEFWSVGCTDITLHAGKLYRSFLLVDLLFSAPSVLLLSWIFKFCLIRWRCVRWTLRREYSCWILLIKYKCWLQT